jgi:hypothetical protein
MSVVKRIAAEAWAAQHAAQQRADETARREADAARRREDERFIAMAMMSPLPKWFPGAKWRLVTHAPVEDGEVAWVRVMEQGTHGPVFEVRENGADWVINMRLLNAHISRVEGPADVGRFLANKRPVIADLLDRGVLR